MILPYPKNNNAKTYADSLSGPPSPKAGRASLHRVERDGAGKEIRTPVNSLSRSDEANPASRDEPILLRGSCLFPIVSG